MANDMSMILIAGLALDLFLKDPKWLYHPTQAIGYFSVSLEKILRRIFSQNLKIAGIVFLITALSILPALLFFILEISRELYYVLYLFILIYITYSFLAVGSLLREMRAVIGLLKRSNLAEARERVQEIVSRDMSQEDKTGVTRAVIETGVENISDGIVAPIFYFALGGPILMTCYKIVNTLDSMVGYKNEKYRDFGWASARFDDFLNYWPARLTGLLIVLTAVILGDDYRKAYKIWMRDGQKGPSPNGGIPITAFAGARNIRLGGPCRAQDGKEENVPYVGGERTEFGNKEAGMVVKYIYWVTILAALIAVAFLEVLP